MQANTTSGQETDAPTDDHTPAHRNDLAAAADEKTLKRARWEAFAFGPVAGEQRVNVVNRSYGDDAGEHTYTVTIGPDGLPAECTCPADEYQPGPCKHAVACADAPNVIAEAMTGGDERSEPEESAGEARGANEVSGASDGLESPEATTMADKLRADGRLVATDGGTERGADTDAAAAGDIEATQPDGEPSDADYCAKYIVPVSECVLTDGEECPHGTITGDTDGDTDGTDAAIATDGGTMADKIDAGSENSSDDETPTCDRCGLERTNPGDDAGASISYCSTYDAVCADCLLDHGPDDCDHDGPTDARTCSECGESFDSFLDCARHERGGCPEARDETARPDAGAEPTRSEPADFGGGESSGVDEL